MLKVTNFSYSYGSNEVIRDFSLELKKGDFVILLGPNGAGKTTFLNSVCGLFSNFKGEINFNNISLLTNQVAYKKNVGFIADEPMILDYLTGMQYLNFIADIFEIADNNRNKLVKYYVEKFKMTDIINNLIITYSHGNKQKISIIAALIHSPKLLVIDEPFTGLDPFALKIFGEVLEEESKKGTIILLATHILPLVENLGNKIILVNNGKFKKIPHYHNVKKIEKEYEEYVNV